ncbi:hypothetical protein ABBQ32_000683 [Trebouxia sp. C0010 RCD-2024]
MLPLHACLLTLSVYGCMVGAGLGAMCMGVKSGWQRLLTVDAASCRMNGCARSALFCYIYCARRGVRQQSTHSADGTHKCLRLRELKERQDQGGVAFVSKVHLVVHTATHFDAPSHFLQEAFDSGRGMESLQLSIMNGPALVVSIPHESNITADVLDQLPIPPGTQRVLFKSVNSAKKLMYQTPFHSNYTALTESGADWVVKHGIKFVGIDYLSIATYDELAPAHQSLMRVVMLLG